jgi:hypothetical protein
MELARLSTSAMWSDKLGAWVEERARTLNEEKGELFDFVLVGKEAEVVQEVVNQGIDAHLEACFIPDRGDIYYAARGRLHGNVSPESLRVLVRRLLNYEGDEQRADAAMGLASGICDILGIELI